MKSDFNSYVQFRKRAILERQKRRKEIWLSILKILITIGSPCFLFLVSIQILITWSAEKDITPQWVLFATIFFVWCLFLLGSAYHWAQNLFKD